MNTKDYIISKAGRFSAKWKLWLTPPMNGLKSFGKRLKFRAVFNSAESGSALYKKITITVDSMKLPCLITEEIEVVGAVIEVE